MSDEDGDGNSDGDKRRTWTIGELCAEFGVTARALRFYEQKGLLQPRRKGMMRIYDGRDRQRLQVILRGKKAGFTLAEIGEMLELFHLRDGQVEQMRESLEKMRRQLDVLLQRRAEIDIAIDEMRHTIGIVESMLKERMKDG